MKKNILLRLTVLATLVIIAITIITTKPAKAGGLCTCRLTISESCGSNCSSSCSNLFLFYPRGDGTFSASRMLGNQYQCTETLAGQCICYQNPVIASSPENCNEICQRIGESEGDYLPGGRGEFAEVPGLGDECDHDSECVGPRCITRDCPLCPTVQKCFCDLGIESYASETEYRATGERGSCTEYFNPGTVCARNRECLSNICDSASGKCADESGRVPTAPEITLPPTEEEVFPTYRVKSPIGEVTGPELIGRIIKAVLGVVGALALAMFVFGGFTWLTSGGSPDKIKKGKDILMWAVIGLIIIFTSYTLVDFILTAFGL